MLGLEPCDTLFKRICDKVEWETSRKPGLLDGCVIIIKRERGVPPQSLTLSTPYLFVVR